MGQVQLEAALPVGADPRRHARALAEVREAALAGTTLRVLRERSSARPGSGCGVSASTRPSSPFCAAA